MTRRPPLIVLGLIVFALALIPFALNNPHSHIARAQATSVDQMSIDTDHTGNGVAGVGDRDGDGLADSEGALDGGGSAANQGSCANALDDDNDGGVTVPPDGVVNDGCVVTLSTLQTCVEIIDDGVQNAGEDGPVADRVFVDVTVGAQPGTSPGAPGGVPAGRPMIGWQFDLNWDIDVVDVPAPAAANSNPNFLIAAAGQAQPFTPITDGTPTTTPFTKGVLDAGPQETGAGVLARFTLEGNAAGLANLTLTSITIKDNQNNTIPVDAVNSAQVAVSKDVNGDTVIAGPSELFLCPQSIDLSVPTVTTNVVPASATTGAGFPVTVDATINNPSATVTVSTDITVDLNLPPDCSSPTDPTTLQNVAVAPGAFAMPQQTFTVTCTQPSFHNFSATVTATEDDAGVTDPNAANNANPPSGTNTPDNAVPITATADLSVVSVSVAGPASATTGTAFNVTVDASLHNLGPNPATADATITLTPPADCTAVGGNVKTANGIPLPVSAATPLPTQTYSVTCTTRSSHTFSATVALAAPLHVTDGVPGNNSANGTSPVVPVSDAADLKVKSIAVSFTDAAGNPITSVPINTPFNVNTDLAVHNNGPTGPVNADITFKPVDQFLPPDCTDVTPPGDGAGAPISLPVSVDTPLQFFVTVECSQPSSHIFTDEATIALTPGQVHIIDPTPGNDTLASAPATIAVTSTADLKVVSVKVSAPKSAIVNKAFNVDVESSVHNNGPFSPVNADVTVTLTIPSGCTATPTATQTADNLSLATSTATNVAKKSWSVTCSQAISPLFKADVSAAIDQLHITDPNAVNNTRTGQASDPTVLVAAAPPGGGPPPTGSDGGNWLATYIAGLAILALIAGASAYRLRRRRSG